jgi:hypothetical protein
VSIRSLILALASGAVFAAALAPVGASAKPMGFKPMPGPILGVKPIFGVKPMPGPHPVLGIVIHPPVGPHLGGWWWWEHHHHEHPWFVEGGYPVSTSVAVTGPATTVTGPASAPCTCLTKTYLNDGSVKFTDVCTKETAIATPDDQRAQR